MLNRNILLSALCACSLVTVAKAPEADIVDTAVASKQFPTLVKLVTDAGLVDTLKGAGPFTVFAPTEKAFAKLPKATLKKLGEDKELLKSVLLYHVVPGKVLAADAVKLNGKTATTANGKDIAIKVDAHGNVRINKSKVVKTDILASNGVIHVIDTVLIPPHH